MKKVSENAWQSKTHRVEVQAAKLGGKSRLYVKDKREHRNKHGKMVTEEYWRLAGEFETATEAKAAAKGAK